MENPFELILKKLELIENHIQNLKIQHVKEILPPKENQWMNIVDTSKYLSVSTSYLYKLTSMKKMPFYKHGKLLYFRKDEIDK